MSSKKHNGNTSQVASAPAHEAATAAAEAVDKWAATVFDAGAYSAAEHAELAALVTGRRIPVVGEIDSATGRIVWYGAPPTRQAE